MLFMKERRSTMSPAIRLQSSSAANALLRSMWKSLTRAEQEKYSQEAEKQRFLRQLQHPGWSNKENYSHMAPSEFIPSLCC
ncbi:transcription factor 7-like [Takifugu rubripes]|uniref:transcription factor 7-like n=1 Tax=Takifugu rubripes TaxID=31033 RepID=UPI001145CBDB|nr:transcription factor 7-like [Takifugu rubripes]